MKQIFEGYLDKFFNFIDEIELREIVEYRLFCKREDVDNVVIVFIMSLVVFFIFFVFFIILYECEFFDYRSYFLCIFEILLFSIEFGIIVLLKCLIIVLLVEKISE